MTGTVILNIVIVLGIIIAGGFLIFFMGDLFMSIANSKKDEKTIKDKEKREADKVREEIEKLPPEDQEKVKANPEVASLVYGGATVEDYNPEEEEKAEEPAEEAEEPAEETEEETEEVDEEEAARNAYIEERRRELMERLAMINEEDEGEEEEEETEEAEEEVDEVVDADEEETEEAEEADDTALEDAKKALEEEKAKNEALVAELNAARAAITTEKPEEVFLSEEDYLARLAVEEERLKVNEKELRACKKEYIPLRRVKRTLESDENKLRRKEALVAKQKVVLYGVNNYSDIDEEKAKKLAEDLDLLDGLKLSVKHCQEVMSANAERYPLLEKMFEILSSQNEQIKANIERTKNELAQLRAKKNGSDTDGTVTE